MSSSSSQIPEDVPEDATLSVEANSDLETPWTEVARRVDDGEWTGSAQVTEENMGNGFIRVEVEMAVSSSSSTAGFMRLGVDVSD